MPTIEEINSIDYWKEQKQLAHQDCVRARNARGRQQAMDLVAEAEQQIKRIKQDQAVASCLGSPVEEATPTKT
jgi:broad specificity phosphatase PhoE